MARGRWDLNGTDGADVTDGSYGSQTAPNESDIPIGLICPMPHFRPIFVPEVPSPARPRR
jgi:hypothetical protein